MRLDHDLVRTLLQKIGELPFDGGFHDVNVEGRSGEEISLQRYATQRSWTHRSYRRWFSRRHVLTSEAPRLCGQRVSLGCRERYRVEQGQVHHMGRNQDDHARRIEDCFAGRGEVPDRHSFLA